MRRYLRADAVALGVVGFVALARVVAGITPGMATREWEVSVALLPPEVWGVGWLLTAVVCFVAMGVERARSVAVGLSNFMLTAWGINWLLVLLEVYGQGAPEVSYLLLTSAIGNGALVGLLVWGIARGKAGDPPDGDEVMEVVAGNGRER